jgi:NAD(P)-dependent dehydrogenase (short-subunit alcohol dehydrogenase family)
MSATANPSVAITGAGSGLGREAAIGFANKRYRVFGTAPRPEEVEDVERDWRRREPDDLRHHR